MKPMALPCPVYDKTHIRKCDVGNIVLFLQVSVLIMCMAGRNVQAFSTEGATDAHSSSGFVSVSLAADGDLNTCALSSASNVSIEGELPSQQTVVGVNISLGITDNAGSACSGTYDVSEGSVCYEMVLGALINWYNAKTECKQRGGVLASLVSDSQRDQIKAKITQMGFDGIPGITAVWLGYTVHHWQITAPDDIFLDQQFLDQKWLGGDPNEFTASLDSCVVLDGPQLSLHDTTCSGTHAYICQSSTITGCIDIFDGVCYQLGTTPRDWDTAMADCQNIGSQFTAVTSYSHMQFLANLMATAGLSDVWVGYKVTEAGIALVAADETTPGATVDDNWGPDLPRGPTSLSPAFTCVNLNTVVLGDAACATVLYAYICQKPLAVNTGLAFVSGTIERLTFYTGIGAFPTSNPTTESAFCAQRNDINIPLPQPLAIEVTCELPVTSVSVYVEATSPTGGNVAICAMDAAVADTVDLSKFIYRSPSRVIGAQVVLSGAAAACSRLRCAALCIKTAGCVGFNHRKDAGCMCAPITETSGLYEAPEYDVNWQLWIRKLY